MSDQTVYRQELASAFVLGHASDDQAREFEALYRSDESFRKLVGEMEAFLAPLNDDAPEAEPPANLFDEILGEIDGETPGDREHELINRGRAPQRPWQYATAASLLIAALATGLHLVPQEPVAPSEREELLALMATDQAPSVVVLLYDSETNRITGRLTNTSLPEDGVWQLWLLRDGIDGPQSLGLLEELSGAGVIDLEVPTELAAESDTLAISLEPAGGSPEAGPTGPIVYTGKVAPI